MSPEDAMPVGSCDVCGEELDHSEMGNCGKCGKAFHWGACGGWGTNEHECNECRYEKDSE